MFGTLKMKLKTWWTKVHCAHNYEWIGFSEVYEGGIRYSMRDYRCSKCGKMIRIDGRNDPYRR